MTCERCEDEPKKIGCGVEFDWDDDMPVICGEDNFKTGHTQLCDKCQNQSQENLKSVESENQDLCKARNVRLTSNEKKTDISLDANPHSPDTQNPQNNSKEFVLSTNEDKTELENVSKVLSPPIKDSATSGSDFCLSDEIDNLAGDLK